MRAQDTSSHVTDHASRPSAAGADRTGPLGRLARLIVAAAAGLFLSSILDEGGIVGFRRPSVLAEPSVWLLDAVMLALFAHLVGRLAAATVGERAARRWQCGALVGLVAALGGAALVGRALSGAVWGFPLADLVWAIDVTMLAETVAAALLAVALGTPGCEVGVWPELLARARGERVAPAAGPACPVGLHLLDAWEARRRARGAGEDAGS
jgi:hypothetical protein